MLITAPATKRINKALIPLQKLGLFASNKTEHTDYTAELTG